MEREGGGGEKSGKIFFFFFTVCSLSLYLPSLFFSLSLFFRARNCLAVFLATGAAASSSAVSVLGFGSAGVLLPLSPRCALPSELDLAVESLRFLPWPLRIKVAQAPEERRSQRFSPSFIPLLGLALRDDVDGGVDGGFVALAVVAAAALSLLVVAAAAPSPSLSSPQSSSPSTSKASATAVRASLPPRKRRERSSCSLLRQWQEHQWLNRRQSGSIWLPESFGAQRKVRVRGGKRCRSCDARRCKLQHLECASSGCRRNLSSPPVVPMHSENKDVELGEMRRTRRGRGSPASQSADRFFFSSLTKTKAL